MIYVVKEGIKMRKTIKGITNEHYVDPGIYGNLEDDMAKINHVFEIFNLHYFENSLDTPVIIISPDMKANVTYRVDKPDGWRKEKVGKTEDELFKIVFSEKVFELETKEIYLLLLKAMINQYDLEQEEIHKSMGARWKRLINNNGHYLSKKYFELCASMGLDIIADESGEKKVVAGKEFNGFYEDAGIEENFKPTYKYIRINNKNKGKKQSMRAFKCTSCGMKIRITKNGDVDIRCYNKNKEGVPCNGTKFVEV